MTDPQSWNRYNYTRNNTVNRIDVTGLQDDTIHLIGYGAYPKDGLPGSLGGDGPNSNALPEINAGDDSVLGGTFDSYLRLKLSNFFKNHGRCERKFKQIRVPVNPPPGGWGPGGGPPDDLVATLGGASQSSEFVNLLNRPEIMSQTPQQLGWNRNFYSGQYNIALSAYFGGSGSGDTVGPGGLIIIAHTEAATRQIFVGHNYDIKGERGPEETILHELLHLVYRGGHPDIAVKLHIPGVPSDPGQISDADASKAINDWLKNNCPP